MDLSLSLFFLYSLFKKFKDNIGLDEEEKDEVEEDETEEEEEEVEEKKESKKDKKKREKEEKARENNKEHSKKPKEDWPQSKGQLAADIYETETPKGNFIHQDR